MAYENIERCCQLHERLTVLYIVDGYTVTLSTSDGDRDRFTGGGESILDAMVDLERRLAHIDIEDIRGPLITLESLAKDGERWAYYAKRQAERILALPRGTRRVFNHYRPIEVFDFLGNTYQKQIRDAWINAVDNQIKVLKQLKRGAND